MTVSPDFSRQSAFSDPGRFAPLLGALPDDVGTLCATARNVIAHYRGELPDLPRERWGEIDSRWLEDVLATDQARHSAALDEPRPLAERVAGCCRDHSLFLVGALRQRGVPARNRVGFADYFEAGFHHDHVVVERRDGGRWIRFDPELVGRGGDFPLLDADPADLPRGPGSPFETAAEVWSAHRRGELDADRYGVFPGADLRGPGFVRTYVLFELAHRQGDELLLWDGWDSGGLEDADVDAIAALLLRADADDTEAEAELTKRYRGDDRLHPGERITQFSPYGLPPREVSLIR